MHSRLRLLHLLGAGATLASIALAGPASPAGAAPPRGQTLLLDRPSGFGPLPFDGAGPAEIGPHPLSGDAAHRWVVFTSSADSLLGGDDDSLPHVYRLDRVSGAVEQVDTGPGGSPFAAVPVGNGGADVSADGRWVAFVGVTPETLLSLSTVVARADGPAPPDPTVPPIGVYVKDMQSGAIELASRGDGPQGAPAGQTWSAALSGDGRHVAFTAEGVVQTQEGTAPADAHDVYLRDLDDDSTHLVSRTATGRAAGGVDLFDVPAISFRGDAVAYLTDNPATADDRDDGRDAYLARALDGTPRTELLSIDADGAGRALDIALSGDGRLAAWSTDGRVYLATASPAVGRATQVNRAKPGATGGMGDQPAFEPVPDGATAPQRLHFRSGQLDPADRNGQLDLYSAELAHPGDAAFVHLLTSATADRSIDAGAAAGAGSVVVYAAAAPNLPAGHSDFSQVYEHTAGGERVLSQPQSPAPRANAAGDGDVGQLHATSDDGTRTVFSTLAPAFGATLAAGGGGSFRPQQVLLRDVASGQTTPLSVTPEGDPADYDAWSPSIDGAGARAAFVSSATNLVPGTASKGANPPHVYVRDLASGLTALVDRGPDARPLTGGVSQAQLSGDGRHLVYVSASADAPGAPGNQEQYPHVYVVDLTNGSTVLADRAPGSGAPADGAASDPDISRDGSRVAFVSRAPNLRPAASVPGNADATNVFVRDLTAATTTWASRAQDDDPLHSDAWSPSLSGDGGHVAFVQVHPQFGHGMAADTQVFVHDLASGATELASRGDGGPIGASAFSPSLDEHGVRVAFSGETLAGDGYRRQAFLRDRGAATTTLISVARDGSSPSRGFVNHASVSADGRCVAFDARGGGLAADDYGPDFRHAYLRCRADATGGAGPGGGDSGAVVKPTTAPRDRTRPRITRARLTHRRFAVVAPARRGAAAEAARDRAALAAGATASGRAGSRRRASTPRGTRFAFTLSEPARVTIAFTRSVPGRRRGKACVAPRAGLKRRCTRTVTVARLTRLGLRAGARTIAFSGRAGRTTLKPGAYRARLVARDAAGNRSRPVTLAFTVVPAPR